jgi:hypothetical protein
MPIRPLLAASLAVAAFAVGGCSEATAPSSPSDARGKCGRGAGKPVAAADLVKVFRKHGLLMYRQPHCDGATDLAKLANFRLDRTGGDEFSVICSIRGRKPFTASIERVHYPGDQETYLRTLNISCSVYPSSAAAAENEIERVTSALRDVVRQATRGSR